MKIREDRSHMNIDTRWFEKGYAKEDVHSLRLQSLCTEAEAAANKQFYDSHTCEEWEQYIRQASLESSAAMKPVMEAIAQDFVCYPYHIPLIINDRIDIAMAVQAAGVHIGQHDLPAATVRKVIGENMLLGVSASSIAEAIQAQQDGADYLGVGAMFPTGTKTDAESVSMEELQKIRTAVSLPIVVIGGINKGNAGRFKPMGIDGLAVVSAIIAQSDIKAAAAELKDLFCGKEKKHGF